MSRLKLWSQSISSCPSLEEDVDKREESLREIMAFHNGQVLWMAHTYLSSSHLQMQLITLVVKIAT